ncbi:MAG: GTPase [Nanoarchaeota archaeon]
MPINAHPEYLQAEKEYSQAQTAEEKLKCLEKMISLAPAHKGAENLRAELRTRYKKLKEKIVKAKKSGKSTQKGIKKSDMQAVLLGFPNTGKSSIFSSLTNKYIKISANPYSTTEPELGVIEFEDVKIQLIDLPPLPNTDFGIINSTDTLLLVIDSLKQLEPIKECSKNSNAKKIIILNKSDLLNNEEKRKISETLKSKKVDFILFSSQLHDKNLILELKKKIFDTFPIIRIYTKEPKKEISKEPMILKQNSDIKDVAEKILKGFSKKIKRVKIWGPSSKFGGQIVGLEHALKDKDVLEFQTE